MIKDRNPFKLFYDKSYRFVGLQNDSDFYCSFDTIVHCLCAVFALVSLFRRKGVKTVEGIINEFYSSHSDVSSSAAISYVCDYMGFHKGYEISVFRPVQMFDFLIALSTFVSGYSFSKISFDDAFELFVKSRSDLFEVII